MSSQRECTIWPQSQRSIQVDFVKGVAIQILTKDFIFVMGESSEFYQSNLTETHTITHIFITLLFSFFYKIK